MKWLQTTGVRSNCSGFNKGMKKALSKFRREKEEEAIIIYTIFLHRKGLRILTICNTPIILKPFASGYRETVKR